MNYKDMAYLSGIVASTLVTIIKMFPNDRLLYSKYCAIIMAAKSLIFVDMNLSDIIHHLLTLILCLYYLYYTSVQDRDFTNLIEEAYIVQSVNVSSIFLGIRHYKKHLFVDLSFFLTFAYYRGIFVYHYFFKGFTEIYNVCPNSQICVQILDKSFLLLSVLNIYWFMLILRKVKRQFQQLPQPLKRT